MSKQEGAVLFLGKENDGHGGKALNFCRRNFGEVTAHFGKWGDPLPENIRGWQGDYLISYLSRWVVPESLLQNARVAAINFHPGPPEYPGIGCNNFALYEEAKVYGATCHHIAAKVDAGAVIAVERFPLFPGDNVATLIARTYDFQLVLFYKIMSIILEGKALPVSAEKWTRRPFTRKELDELQKITPDMSKEEVAKRVRATSFGVWQPTVDLQGFIFELQPNSDADRRI